MTYDLEWAELPEPAAAARERYKACLDLGHCEHVPQCWEPYYALAEPFQFHLNSAGMGFCRVGIEDRRCLIVINGIAIGNKSPVPGLKQVGVALVRRRQNDDVAEWLRRGSATPV